MEGRRFDDLTRRLTDTLNRRRVVASLLGVAGAAALGSGAEARVRCRAYDASCTRSAQCCTAYCETSRQAARRRRNRCSCPPGLGWCDGVCVDLTTKQNCGTCGEICTGQEICLSGACVCQPDCDGKCGGDDGCGGECPGAGRYWSEGTGACLTASDYCATFEWVTAPSTGDNVDCMPTVEGTIAYACNGDGRYPAFPESWDQAMQSCASSADCEEWLNASPPSAFNGWTRAHCITRQCQSFGQGCYPYGPTCVVQVGSYTEDDRLAGVCF
jgi:hypothetical protein